MNSVFVFSDEAGAYKTRPSESFRNSHPFYLRSNICLSVNDYRLFQNEVYQLNARFRVPVGEEIKWSDLWEVHNGRIRADFLNSMSEDALKGYYRNVFTFATDKASLQYLFTITCVFTNPCFLSENAILKFHIQEALQRINMDARPDGFATLIMDELNQDVVRQIKAVSHDLVVTGDLINYQNIYSGVLVESSSQSAGIQLADYSAGVLNGYLRGALLNRGRYEYATDLYNQFIRPRLRCSYDGRIMGYGIREVPRDTQIRNVLLPLFDGR